MCFLLVADVVRKLKAIRSFAMCAMTIFVLKLTIFKNIQSHGKDTDNKKAPAVLWLHINFAEDF
jgi:hypothetical protein